MVAKKTVAKAEEKKVVNLRGKETSDKPVVAFKDKKELVAEKNEKIAKEKEVAKEAPKKTEKKVEEALVEIKKQEVKYELSIGVQDLFAAGAHLGHKLAKTNPKVTDYIYAAKDGIQVIDLPKTYKDLEAACGALHAMAKEGKVILMVGTKRQAREVVRRVATEIGMPYVTSRWLGGTVSNWDQIRKSIRTMNELEKQLEKGVEGATKKEISVMRKNFVRMQTGMGGLKNLEKLFDAMFVVDAGYERTAIGEARMRDIPVFGILDTDSNPNLVDYPIVANDDSAKSVTMLVEEVGKAISSAKK